MLITFGVAIVQNVAFGAPTVSVARGTITGNFESFLLRIFFYFLHSSRLFIV